MSIDPKMAREDAVVRFSRSGVTLDEIWDRLRGLPDDLRAAGLTVAVHNDYQLDGKPHTFWLMTAQVGADHNGKPLVRAFKGEGTTDREALDQIRAAYANATDDHHHSPMCPANHYHGMWAPLGGCTCGAIEAGYRRKR